jgi:hypothetical protein
MLHFRVEDSGSAPMLSILLVMEEEEEEDKAFLS